MTCTNCGREVAEGMSFCNGCGVPMPMAASASAGALASPSIPTTKPCPFCGEQIMQAAMTGGYFVFSGTNGAPGWTYYVLASTNLEVPLAGWAVIATNAFDGAGNFSFSNAVVPGSPREFYAMALGTLPPDAALPATIALFKTPTVRDLVSSEPYLHTGQMDTIDAVIAFYQTISAQARAGRVRNADPQLSGIFLDASAGVPLAAFLRALNEEAYVDIPCPCEGTSPPP